MKKIYNQPTFIIVELGTQQMMAESASIVIDDELIDPELFEVKEESIRDVNLWDNEW